MLYSIIKNSASFEELSNSLNFEDITNGRKGAVLASTKDNLIPIVRTTTKYTKPVQKFLPVHESIIKKIASNQFNNALIEIYDNKYISMGYHSDQSLDLVEGSYICIFSCYDDPNTNCLRKLKIKEKNTENCSELILEHNSIVLFSTGYNSKHLHKIVLENNHNNHNTRWLGITFRLSKTFICFINEMPYFNDNSRPLKMANKDQIKEYYTYRSEENKRIEYKYPDIDYTISISDTLIIEQ